MSFKDKFKFPLGLHHGKVMTEDFHMAFDFPQPWMSWTKDKSIFLPKEQQQKLVDILNEIEGVEPTYTHEFFYKNGEIFEKESGKMILYLRGWGYLTGIGGLNLSGEEAATIQDEFGAYIVEKLTNR